MKILVVGGMHGNEPLGLAVVKLFKQYPVTDVSGLFANKKAIKRNCRFTQQDLNRSFPGNLDSEVYESRRAAELVVLCKKYDVVFDFHNTGCPNNDCSFVGTKGRKCLYDVSKFLGLPRIIVADYECINKYATNCISIEISLKSKKMDPKLWYDKIKKLQALPVLPRAKKIKKYTFVYRMTLEDEKRLRLRTKNLKAFRPLNKKLANQFGVKTPAYPIFIADPFTPYNYGGILNKRTPSRLFTKKKGAGKIR